MRLCSIASGSSGNCIYVGTDTTHLLVDAGISGKRTECGLRELNLSLRDIDGVLITHEHSDHISGLGVISRKYGIPIYGSAGTIEAIRRSSSVGKVDEGLYRVIQADDKFTIQDLTVHPMRISHDAQQPLAYHFSYGRKKVGIITDLGTYDEYTLANLRGLDAVLLEANHDINMLQVGPYPYYLKQRILGERGHLSNEMSGRLLSCILHDHMKKIVLGHLSKENNLAELAYETVRVEIAMGDSPYRENDFPISVAKRSEVSEVIEI